MRRSFWNTLGMMPLYALVPLILVEVALWRVFEAIAYAEWETRQWGRK